MQIFLNLQMLSSRWENTILLRKFSKMSPSALCSQGSCQLTTGRRLGLQSSPYWFLLLLLHSLHLLFCSSFIFMVGNTWCCLGVAWVCIDSSSLWALGGCLKQGFIDTYYFVVALYSFSASLVCSSLSCHKMCWTIFWYFPVKVPSELWFYWFQSKTHSSWQTTWQSELEPKFKMMMKISLHL